jgi:hypothetical protein
MSLNMKNLEEVLPQNKEIKPRKSLGALGMCMCGYVVTWHYPRSFSTPLKDHGSHRRIGVETRQSRVKQSKNLLMVVN